VEAYHPVRRRALAEHPDAFGRAIEELQSPAEMAREFRAVHDGAESFVLGALDGGLVGIASCTRERGVKNRHKALLWGMYVVPEARGRGVGRRLVAAVIERARAWPGLEQVWLAVAAHNEPARALYRACGFEAVWLERRALKLPDRYVDEEHMVLHLSGGPPC
jgi:RimJ/RimL family protein N-acetyltransferase